MSAVDRHDTTRLQGRGVLCDPDRRRACGCGTYGSGGSTYAGPTGYYGAGDGYGMAGGGYYGGQYAGDMTGYPGGYGGYGGYPK